MRLMTPCGTQMEQRDQRPLALLRRQLQIEAVQKTLTVEPMQTPC